MGDHEIVRQALVQKLEELVETTPDPDRKVFLTADGTGSSIRDTLHEVRCGTAAGNEFVKDYVSQVIDFIIQK